MKIGDVRFSARIDEETGKIEYSKYVLRSIQNRLSVPGRSSHRTKYTYWVTHIHGITWVKQSTRHGDWGYCKDLPTYYKTKRMFSMGAPYSASKAGALMALKKSKKDHLKRFGEWQDDEDYEEEDGYVELTMAEQIKKISAAQKRLKKAQK